MVNYGTSQPFSGAFAKLRQAAMFVISVFVRTEQRASHGTDFREILFLNIF
jgi:hypothetical protein